MTTIDIYSDAINRKVSLTKTEGAEEVTGGSCPCVGAEEVTGGSCPYTSAEVTGGVHEEMPEEVDGGSCPCMGAKDVHGSCDENEITGNKEPKLEPTANKEFYELSQSYAKLTDELDIQLLSKNVSFTNIV